MGCASSNPLMETGKNFIDNAKVSANDMVIKGEQTLHGKLFGKKLPQFFKNFKTLLKFL